MTVRPSLSKGRLCRDRCNGGCHTLLMIQLRPIIDRIDALLAEDTDASITYAALEARFALEKVVYDRLRQRHEYISHAQLRAWTPGDVVKRLLIDVDQHMTDTVVLQMSRHPHVPGQKVAEDDWLKIGTEIGFDAKKIAAMWQALSGLALHVRLPKDKNDQIQEYGDKDRTYRKVREVVAELERLSAGTMTFSGVPDGRNVSFECSCGENNKRRAKLLEVGQHVYCINPKCDQTWKVVEKDGDEVTFESVLVDVACKNCGSVNRVPWRKVTGMKYDQMLSFPCVDCKSTILVRWHLMQASLPQNTEEAA